MASRLAGLVLLLVTSVAAADDWPGPRVLTVFSEDSGRFVRILPGNAVGDSVGFTGGPRGSYARGEIYARQPDRAYRLVADVALANPVAPVAALLSNDGYLLTLDNWHNRGHGAAVLAVYAPSGALLRAYRLEDLYPAPRLAAIPASVSSRSWRCGALGFVDPRGSARSS